MTDLNKPNVNELRQLKRQEPAASYEPIAVPGFSQGRQSRVSVIQFKVGDGYEPIVWKRMAAGKQLTEEEAVDLEPRIRTYRRSLRDHKWNVPKINHSHPLYVDNEWQIWSYDQYIEGGDGDFLIKNPDVPNYQKWHVLRTIIETLADYPTESLFRWKVKEGKTLTGLIHGIDLKLANIVSNRNMVWFVDLFGPKEVEWTPVAIQGENSTFTPSWVTYNTKLDSLNSQDLLILCATREGAILRLYRLAEQLWLKTGASDLSDLRANFFKILKQVYLPLGEQELIRKEIESDYEWLNSIYSEYHI